MFRIYHESFSSPDETSAADVRRCHWILQTREETRFNALAVAHALRRNRVHVKITSSRGTEFISGR